MPLSHHDPMGIGLGAIGQSNTLPGLSLNALTQGKQ